MTQGFFESVDGEVLGNQPGSGEPYASTPMPKWVEDLPPVVRQLTEAVLREVFGVGGPIVVYDSAGREKGAKTKAPWVDHIGNLHCGICNKFMSRNYDCVGCDEKGGGVPRYTPRRVARTIREVLGGEGGNMVDPTALAEELAQRMWNPLPPDDRIALPGGDEIGIWDENGFVGHIPEGAHTEEGLDIRQITDTGIRVEPVDRSVDRPGANIQDETYVYLGGMLRMMSDPENWDVVSVRNHKGDQRIVGIARRSDIEDVARTFGRGRTFRSDIILCVREKGRIVPGFTDFSDEELRFDCMPEREMQ